MEKLQKIIEIGHLQCGNVTVLGKNDDGDGFLETSGGKFKKSKDQK